MNEIIQSIAIVVAIISAVITVAFAIKSVNTYRRGRYMERAMIKAAAKLTDGEKVEFSIKLKGLGYDGPMPWLEGLDIQKSVNDMVEFHLYQDDVS